MIKCFEIFHFKELVLNAKKIGSIRLSVYISRLNVSERKNNFVLGVGNTKGTIFELTRGATELIEIAEVVKNKTSGNFIIAADKKYMNC